MINRPEKQKQQRLEEGYTLQTSPRSMAPRNSACHRGGETDADLSYLSAGPTITPGTTQIRES